MGNQIVCDHCQQPETENADNFNARQKQSYGSKRQRLSTSKISNQKDTSFLSISSIKFLEGTNCQVLYRDGSCYKGQMLNKMRHGQGVQYLDGVQYQGMWRFDKAQGKGKLKSKNFQAEGHFQANHIIKGKIKVFKDKRTQIYQGQFENFKYHGNGMLTILGQFKNHKKQGRGKIVYENGSIYQGQFKNGKMNGLGIYKSLQFQYNGEFKDNKITGKGICKTKQESYVIRKSMLKIEKQQDKSIQINGVATFKNFHSFTFAKQKLRA